MQRTPKESIDIIMGMLSSPFHAVPGAGQELFKRLSTVVAFRLDDEDSLRPTGLYENIRGEVLITFSPSFPDHGLKAYVAASAPKVKTFGKKWVRDIAIPKKVPDTMDGLREFAAEWLRKKGVVVLP
jgi:hypothetical protein